MDFISEKIYNNDLPVDYKMLPLPVKGNFLKIYNSWSRDIRKISPDKIIIMEGRVDEFPLFSVLAAYTATHGNVYMTEHSSWPEPPPRTRSIHYGFVPGIGLWWYKLMWGMRIRSYLSKRVLAVSQAVKDTLLMYGYPKEKIAIAYHGVDVLKFSPSEINRMNWRRRHNIPENSIVLISTARLAYEKRLHRLIHAFNALSQDHENLWLLFVGDGPLRKDLEILVNPLTGKDRVIFLGLSDNVPELLQASDIFVLPSDREGLSVSLTEAMSTGLICIASNLCGSNEVIKDGVNGFLVDPSDQGILHGIEKALNLDDQEKKSIKQEARYTILENFEKRKSVSNILKLLDVDG
jgi:glycosyltransferase involved in cell wall biosynthesis